MAMTLSDAAKALVHNKTIQNKTESQVSLASKSLPATTQQTASYLDTPDLAQFCKVGRFSYVACRQEMAERKRVSEELLFHVFNADPEKVQEFFTKSYASIKMVLKKTSCREGYFSNNLNMFVCVRRWKSVSPLQAAALCLDKFLMIRLLKLITGDNVLRLEAIKQLKEVSSRISTVTSENVAVVTSKYDNKGDRKHYQETETLGNATTIANIATAILSGNMSKAIAQITNAAISATVERKLTAERARSPADLAEYAAPIKALIKAYSDYESPRDSLESLLSTYQGTSEKVPLWDVVGDCQRNLPRYILQEFFKGKRWSDDRAFFDEPARGALQTRNGDLLDLDKLGGGSSVALKKGMVASADYSTGGMGTRVDQAAINQLYVCRLDDLENIINILQEMDDSVPDVVAVDKNAGLKNT